MRQRYKGLLTGGLVGASLGIWLVVSLHAVLIVALMVSMIVGGAIAAVVSTRPSPEDNAADAAWQLAARDLPPLSDRAELERSQGRIDAPARRSRSGGRSGSDQPRRRRASQGGGVELP